MNKTTLLWVIVVVVVGAGGFFAGKSVGGGRSGGYGARGAGTGQQMGMRGIGGMGGFAAGQITDKTDTTITIKMTNGDSKTVTYSPLTPILKPGIGTSEDLSVGTTITVQGSVDTNGNVTATSIQVRPAQQSPTQSPSAR